MNTRKAGKRDQGANSIGAAIRFKHCDLPMLYDRLRSYGYNSLDALVRDFIAGKFPPPKKPEPALDVDYLKVKIRKIMALTGNAGLLAKVTLLAGLRAEEALYIHRAEICDISGCDCHKLHIADGNSIRQDGLSIIIVNWLRGDGKRCWL